MISVLVVCHLVEGRFDGQQAKTNDVISSLKKKGIRIDILNYGKLGKLRAPFASYRKIKKYSNILIMPGGKKALFLYVSLSKLFKNKNFYYLAVGGWIEDLVLNRRYHHKLDGLKKFKCLAIQNKRTVQTLNDKGFKNVLFIPTFSSKPQLTKQEFERSLIEFDKNKKYRFCFYARVTESKGIFQCCNVINKLAAKGFDVSLDIYGQIQEKTVETKLHSYLNKRIKYFGVLHDDAIKVLSNYYCMIFPTYYRGEGMAHTIIESFMAGLPVVATNWRFNSELITDKQTGFLFDVDQLENNLFDTMTFVISNRSLVKENRVNCFHESEMFNSDYVLSTFINVIVENDIEK